MPSLLPADRAIHDIELLHQMRGRRLAQQLRVLCVVGAHRFDELPLIDRLFPQLERIYLFEPQPEPVAALNLLAARDARLRVFPVAVSDRDGSATFHVASNAGESSSLLELGTHRELFPEVSMRGAITVPTRRLDSVLDEHALPLPDALLIDVQGFEYAVIASLPPRVLDAVRFIYSEVSTEAVYAGSRPLADVQALLATRFVNLGFAPLNPQVSVHGNAVFVARRDVDAAIGYTWRERARLGFHAWRRRVRPKRT